MLTKQLINSRAKTISPFDLFYILGKGIYMQLVVNEEKKCVLMNRGSLGLKAQLNTWFMFS